MSDRMLLADWPAPANIVAGTTTREGDESDLPAEPSWLRQVHGNRAVTLGSSDFGDAEPEADAVIGRQSGNLCVVRTADCLPVLVCARDGSEIAAIHAGWRGLAAGVIDATVAKMSTAPAELLAWLGPAISQPCFEVGAEVREAFVAAGFDAANRFEQNPAGRWQADLFGLAADRLEAIGVAGVYGERRCTFANPALYFSYRRDGSTGRLLSFVYRK
ncbi:MAG: peptidoglycan editing factor PgeF [Woeseiaceae bacterium]